MLLDLEGKKVTFDLKPDMQEPILLYIFCFFSHMVKLITQHHIQHSRWTS